MASRFLISAVASLVVLASYLAFPACAAPGKVYASSMQERLQYRGFSVARPASAGWYLVSGEQSHTDALFRREVPADGTYSAFLGISLRSLPRAATSEADFAQLVRQDKISDSQRFTVLSYHQKPLQVQGQWAIEYEVSIRDQGAPVAGGKPLILHQSGRVIRHPTFPNGVVIINDSERGTRKELSPKIQSEGESISAGIRLESAPGRPVN